MVRMVAARNELNLDNYLRSASLKLLNSFGKKFQQPKILTIDYEWRILRHPQEC
jgi:hypothetical protein